jgi:bacillopeptidase F (M6 metalloprotease family)
LTSQSLNLTPGEASVLSFYTYYDIEPRYDGGVVEITADKETWDRPVISPAYPNTFRSTSDQCGYDENTPAFSGTATTWQQHTMDLSAYQGQNINIRFSYSTDSIVNPDGWFIDDVAVTNTQVPGVCTTISDLIFANDFE